MKNFIKKFAKILSLAILNVLLFSNLAIADETPAKPSAVAKETAAKALSDLQGSQCYDPKIPGADGKPATGKDNPGYIMTIIEESLDPNIPEKPETLTEDFHTYICYRNTFIYRVDKEETIVSELATKCSDEAQKPEYADPKKFSFYCQQVQVFLSKGGTSLIEGYISTIFNWAFGLVGLISVLVIMISAAQISLSGGDTQAIDSAKTRILKSLAGIAVLALAGLILYTINPNFFIK